MLLRKAIFISVMFILLTSCSLLGSSKPGAGGISPERVVESLANQVVFQPRSEFEVGDDLGKWGMNQAELQEGLVQLEGDQSWGTYLVSLAEIGPGHGMITRFQFAPRAVFNIVLQHGEWNTPEFREIGFGRFDQGLQSTVTIGADYWETADPWIPQDFKPATWYQAAFFVEEGGAFVVKFWSEQDPAQAGTFSWKLAEEDRDLDWRLAVQVHSQRVEVDSAAVFQFSSLESTAFPELAALQSLTTPQPSLTPSQTPIPSATSIPSATPLPTLGASSTRLNPADQANLRYIPAGEYLMGFEEDRAAEFHDQGMDPVDLEKYPGYYDQLLPHAVDTDAFWMYQSEVTNQQFAVFLNEMGNQVQAPYNNPKRGGAWYVGHEVDPPRQGALVEMDGDWRVIDDREDHPAVWVDWYGARAYCEWAGGRLPTEAEWEKAARGGLDAKLFPWGDEPPENDPGDQAANGARFSIDGQTRTGTVPVGSYAANGFGLFNMAGNVFEWTADWYAEDAYLNPETDNPQGPTYAERDLQFDLFDRRVIRGGSWYHSSYYLAAWYRGGSYPFSHEEWLGFRCAVDLE